MTTNRDIEVEQLTELLSAAFDQFQLGVEYERHRPKKDSALRETGNAEWAKEYLERATKTQDAIHNMLETLSTSSKKGE